MREWHRKNDGDEEGKLGNEKGKTECEKKKKRVVVRCKWARARGGRGG